MKYSSFFVIAALMCLLMSAPCMADTGRLVFVEEFDSNINNWATSNDKDGSSYTIKNGRYILTNTTASMVKSTFKWFPSIANVNDFEIDASIGFLNGKPGSEYGIQWGKYKHIYHYFELTGNGRYLYGAHMLGKWINFVNWKDSPKILQHGLNHIKVKKTGNTQEYFINGESVGKLDFVPLFGNEIGFLTGPGITVEADRIVVTMTRHTMPDGITVTTGHFENTAEWPDRRDEKSFRTQIEKGSDLSVTKRIDGKEVTASALIKAKNPNSGCIPALFIQTDDNALLKLEKISSGKITKARFCLYSAGKETGCKESVIPAGETTLRITRKGDKFTGEAAVAGKTVTVGELDWPGLMAKQEAGVLFPYKSPAIKSPVTVSTSFEVREFVVVNK